MFFLPSFIVQSMSDDEMDALVLAHWIEFQLEEVVRTQEGEVIEREAKEYSQVQLAIHKLERARMEARCYLDAIRKAANRIIVARHPVPGESGSSATKAILISRQMRLRNCANR
jgi:pyruvate/oxaloacetate carboxyltransferase